MSPGVPGALIWTQTNGTPCLGFPHPAEHPALGFLTQWSMFCLEFPAPRHELLVLPNGHPTSSSASLSNCISTNISQQRVSTGETEAQGSQTCPRPEANPAAGVDASAEIIQFNHKTISPSALGAWCASFPFPTKPARAVKSGWFTVI